ncbi:MAG: nucleotide exchange factor GrpE [Ginsengibacter sp.]
MENNNKKDFYEEGENEPIEAADFSVNDFDVKDNGEENIDTSAAPNENAKLSADLEEQKDKYLRLVAEFENFKRRNSKERIELIQTAGKEVITSLLQVLDDSDRAEKQMKETDDPAQIKEGVLLVFDKLRKTLKTKGLEPMQSLHEEFDVEKHEAITEIPVQDKKMIGKVVDEVEKGYYLNGKLIRFAKVVVGK